MESLCIRFCIIMVGFSRRTEERETATTTSGSENFSRKKSNMSADDDFEEIKDSDKTPVTIITGFLGSGKVRMIVTAT